MPIEVENPCVPPATPDNRVPGISLGGGLARVAITHCQGAPASRRKTPSLLKACSSATPWPRRFPWYPRSVAGATRRSAIRTHVQRGVEPPREGAPRAPAVPFRGLG